MSQVLEVVELERGRHHEPQPSLLQKRPDHPLMVDDGRALGVATDSDYFDVLDISSYPQHSYDPQEGENYESLVGTDFLWAVLDTIRYDLINSSLEANDHIQSTRFLDDIIFVLNDSKLFEVGTVVLTSGVVASSLMLPEGFNVAVPLLLSASLLVCICGLLTKHRKKIRARFIFG